MIGHRASRTIARVTSRLLLDERILADGAHARTYVSLAGDRVCVEDEAGPAGELSIAAVDRVMTRYGLPLDAGVALDGDTLELGAGRRLRRLRYHAQVDATGRDYLVWERPDHEPIAVLATHATAAIRYLVARLAGERPQDSEG